MNNLRLLAHQVRITQRALRRNKALVASGAAFPVVFLVIIATVFGDERIDALNGLEFNRYFVPQVITLAVAVSSFTNLGIVITTRRERGEFIRLRTTPAPRWLPLTEAITNAVLAAVFLAAVTSIAGIVLYDAPLPSPAIGPALLVGAASCAALGVAAGGAFTRSETAIVGMNVLFWPISFISGTFFFIPADTLLYELGRLLPLSHMADMTTATFESGTPNLWSAFVVALWGIGGTAAAMLTFRWDNDPRSSRRHRPV